MIFEVPRISAWLDQFKPPHRYLAEYLLAKLRYVSLEEVEAWVQSEVTGLVNELCKDGKRPSIAIFSVSKPFVNEFNKDKEAKKTSDSSGRIAHMLRNLERSFPGHIELNPRVESMRARKVEHVVFVDDFIGTGDRFIKSWRKTVPRSVKSWAAFGWCKIWVLAFAAHESGARRIERELKAVDRARCRFGLSIGESFIQKNRNLRMLCFSGGGKSVHPRKALGYGDLCSPIVFQYGCPNNAPGMLWNRDTPRGGVRPLFPNRSVPADTFCLFGKDHSGESAAEELWLSRRYTLALRYIDDPQALKDRRIEMVMLAHLASGKKVSAIRSFMVLSEADFDVRLKWLEDLGFVDATLSVTRFGIDFLRRGARRHPSQRVASEEYQNYYPGSFLGFQRSI